MPNNDMIYSDREKRLFTLLFASGYGGRYAALPQQKLPKDICCNLGNHQTLPSPIDDDRTAYISLFSRANAAEYINTSMLREPNISASSRFLRGVFGTKLNTSGDERYFVIVGFHNSKEKALEQVDLLATKRYKAVVYNPDTNSNFYAVVIASYVTREEAYTVKEQAIQNGLSPNDIYIK